MPRTTSRASKTIAHVGYHFRPETYEKCVKFGEFFNRRLIELLSKYGSRIKYPGDFMILEPITTKKSGILGKLGVTETEFKKRDVPLMIDLGRKGELTKEQIAEISELKVVLENKKAFNEKFQLYRELAGEIALLILKTEMGTPLEGRCSLCSKVRIVDKEGVKP